MSMFDKLFGEKVEITFTDENGIERSKKILKSDLEQWERDGRLSIMKKNRVNIVGPNGVRIEEWTVGIEIEKESVNKYLDKSSGELYVVEVFEEGEPKHHLMMKPHWEEFKNKLPKSLL